MNPSEVRSICDGLSTDHISQFRMKKIILDTLDLCSSLRRRHGFLVNNNEHLKNEEFEKCFFQIDKIKKELNIKMELIRNTKWINLIKRKFSKNTLKRIRLKQNKIENAYEKSVQKKKIATKLAEIHFKMHKNFKELNFKRKFDEPTRKIDTVSKEVTKRQIEAKQFIILLDRLCDLRNAREKSEMGRDMNFIAKLKIMWKNTLIGYMEEEKLLREKIKNENIDAKNTITLDVINIDDAILNVWKNIMFGNVFPLCTAQLNELIHKRKQWDQYINVDSDSTRIPLGWLVPPVTCDVWEKFINFIN